MAPMKAPMKWAMKNVMKKPAMAAPRKSTEEEDEENEEAMKGEEEAEQEAATATKVMKKPAMAAPGKSTEEDEEDKEAGKKDKGINLVAQMRVSGREVAKKKGFITRLEAEKATLGQKLKANAAALRRAAQELECLEEVARKDSRKANRVKNDKIQALLKVKAERVGKSKAKTDAAFKAAKKRADAAKAALGVDGTAQQKFERAKAVVAEAEKQCKEMQAKGLEVPKPGDTSMWEYSSPGAWHPPGVMAAKARHEAKQALAKVQVEWEKKSAVAAAKEAKYNAAKERLNAVKEQKRSFEEQTQVLSEVLANPRKAGALQALKAAAKPKAKAEVARSPSMKVVSSPKLKAKAKARRGGA